jgi:hypothetical protein
MEGNQVFGLSQNYSSTLFLSKRTASLQDSNQQIDIPDAKMKNR